MARVQKYIRVGGWKRNPADPKGTKEGVPNFLRWMGWSLNPKWSPPEPTLKNIKVDLYLTGNIVPIKSVPRKHRKAYRDTLARFALACHRAGYGPGGNKGKRHVNSTYRFNHEQVALFEKNMIAPGIPKPGHAFTAVPGKSPHEKGIGLDVPDVRDEDDLIRECRILDLWDDVPSEKWHLTNHAA